MKQLIFLSTILLFSTTTFSQENGAYTIFNSKGKRVKYSKMIGQLGNAQIILFGEFHNNPISHWLQLEVTLLLQKSNDLVLGAEMFEADNQDELNRYLSEEIDAKALDSLARLWPNYATDYKPLVNIAKENKLTFVATNIPRRYARKVFKGGFEALDSLSEEEKTWMAPLPINYDAELPGYVEMLSMMGGHGGENLPKAQAIKDATMAYFILKNFHFGETFLHYNGAYHSNNYEGILWHLQQKRPELKYTTISTVSQKNIAKLEDENKGIADFIICVDEDMTSTH